jgi:hypothetical protein
MDQQPSVGRIVHYVAYGTPGGEFPAGVCRSAIVTEVETKPDGETLTSLCVVNPTGLFYNRWLKQDEQGRVAGTWHWPERV